MSAVGYWHRDLGTPPAASGEPLTLTIDGVEVTAPAGTSVLRAALGGRHRHSETVRHRFARAVRLLPGVPGRDRGPQGHARVVHHAGRVGHGRAHPNGNVGARAQRRAGTVHLGSSARLPHVRGQRRLRIAGRRRRRLGCATCATASPAQITSISRKTYRTPTSRSIRRSASSARAACARARKCRERSR